MGCAVTVLIPVRLHCSAISQQAYGEHPARNTCKGGNPGSVTGTAKCWPGFTVNRQYNSEKFYLVSAVEDCVNAISLVSWCLQMTCFQMLLCHRKVTALADWGHVRGRSVAVVLCAGADR